MITIHSYDVDNNTGPGTALIRCTGSLKMCRSTNGRRVKTTIDGTAWELYCEVVKEFGYPIALELFEDNPYWIPPHHNRLDFKLDDADICLVINHQEYRLTQETLSITGNVFRLNLTDPEEPPELETFDVSVASFIDLVGNQKFASFHNTINAKLALPTTYERLLATKELRLGEYTFHMGKDGGVN